MGQPKLVQCLKSGQYKCFLFDKTYVNKSHKEGCEITLGHKNEQKNCANKSLYSENYTTK